MVLLNPEQNERNLLRLQANREELAELIGRTLIEDGTREVLPGLFFHRYSTDTGANHGVSDPAFCIVAQGSKEVLLGDNTYLYDPAHYLLATLEMPTISRLVEVSKDKPYLGLRIQLDPNLVTAVIVEAGYHLPLKQASSDTKAINVSTLDAHLLDAVVRLARLVESPADARLLAPLIKREIIYRLYMGEQSERLRYLAALGGQIHRIIKVMDRLRNEYYKPIRIEEMAQDIGMSVSGLHHHFKAVTAMSPLQFQKHLRLQEARRLMLTEKMDATSAGNRVGYDNAAHFSREYKSLFGNPPMRDTEQLREVVGQGV
jgi:AraC-like DNA-binding protein